LRNDADFMRNASNPEDSVAHAGFAAYAFVRKLAGACDDPRKRSLGMELLIKPKADA
jgi:hypothetical protein